MRKPSLRIMVILSVVLYHFVLLAFLIVPLMRHVHELVEEELRVAGDETLALIGALLGETATIDADARSRLDEALTASAIYEKFAIVDSSDRVIYAYIRDSETAEHESRGGLEFLDFMHSRGHEFERQLALGPSEASLQLSLTLNTLPFNSVMARHIYSSLQFFIVLICTFLAVFFFADLILKRATSTLIALTKRISKGELDLKITLHTGDAMEQLADGFNEMAVSLRQRTAELTRLKNFHESLVRSINQGLVQVNKYGHITYCNSSFAELIGREPRALQDTPLTAHLPYLASAELSDIIGRLLEGKQVENSGRRLTRGEEEHVVDEYWTTRRDERGAIEGFILLLTDVSERARLSAELENYATNLERLVEERAQRLRDSQAQLIHAEKMTSLGVFAAGVAHEMSNPLAGILSAVELMRRDLDQAKREVCDEIITNIMRVQAIINDLVSYAKPTYQFSANVDLDKLIKRVVSFFARQPKFKRHKIMFTPRENPVPVRVDANKLEHVLQNLLLNALQATGESGTVTFRILGDDQAQQLRIEVEDDGPGVPEEIKANIFTPFFSTKAPGQGTGLGLSLSQRLMTEMGGALYLADGTGHGAKFVVQLPPIDFDATEGLDLELAYT